MGNRSNLQRRNDTVGCWGALEHTFTFSGSMLFPTGLIDELFFWVWKDVIGASFGFFFGRARHSGSGITLSPRSIPGSRCIGVDTTSVKVCVCFASIGLLWQGYQVTVALLRLGAGVGFVFFFRARGTSRLGANSTLHSREMVLYFLYHCNFSYSWLIFCLFFPLYFLHLFLFIQLVFIICIRLFL